MNELEEKEEILEEANKGNLEYILKYLHLTKEEQFITNEERDFLYWVVLTNHFNNLLNKFEEYKEKKDYFGLADTINFLIDIYGLMEAFVEEDINGYFSVEDDDPKEKKDEKGIIELKKMIEAEDFSLMDKDLLNYKGVKEIVNIRRNELIDILSEFNLLSKSMAYEITLPRKEKNLIKYSDN